VTTGAGTFGRIAGAVVTVVLGVSSLNPGVLARDATRPGAAVIDAVALPVSGDAIRVDGDLTERSWTSAASVSGFQQREPAEGAPATHATDVRVLFDAAAMYVAVRAFDPEPDRIVGLLTRRDDSSPSDWISVLIDSYYDRRTAFEFGINPAGVKFDRYWFNDYNSDRGWDAVWDAAVSRHPEGWQAEFRIPFSQLRFRAEKPEAIGFAVVRTVARDNETSTWPLLAKSASGYVSSFGELRGLSVAGSMRRLELMPYALGQMTTAPVDGSNPLVASPDPDVAVGVDLKYQLTQGLTLTGTVNPDFGQVEADPAVVNLGAFETFFEERRPFFVEGSGNFSFNNLFYSRRIGRPPQRSMDAPDDGFVTQPANSTVLAAVKVTGRVGAFAVGALNAVTTAEYATVSTGPAGTRSTAPVEPTTSYTVGRISREFADKSRLSMMMTSTNRRLPGDLEFLPRSAYAGAIDGDWRLGADRFSLSGFWIGSSVQGSADAIDRLQRSNVHSFQRPDADHLDYDPLRTSLRGHSGGLSLSKISGQRTRGNVNVGYRSPGYEVNDLGFQPRADEIWQNAWLQVRSENHGKYIRYKNINFNQWSGFNFGGDRRELGGNVNSHWTFNSGWGFGSGFNVNSERFADRHTRGGPGALVPPGVSQWGYLDTDSRRAVSLNFFGAWFRDRVGSRSWEANVGVTLRPGTSLTLNPRIEYSRNRSPTQWIENVDDDAGTHYVFGSIDQTTVGVSLRANYTLRPTITLQIYARPFVSAGAYAGFKELTDGLARHDDDRYRPFAYGEDPNFNVRSFRTTNVLRWEYRPGSALFVVWQQGREDTLENGDFRFGRDVGGVFATPSTNVLLIKVSRWLNF
jgi:hypothetical protein